MLAYSGAVVAASLIINIIISAVLAAVVYVYGRGRHHTLALVGLVVTLILGILLGFVIGLIVALIFIVAIWASTRNRRTTATTL